MSKDKKRLVPVRRFKEFENSAAWEQRKLGEVVERFDNLRIPVTSSKRERGITPYYGANGIQDYVQGYTHDGEFVLVAEDGANDLQNYPIHYVNGKVWVNNHAHVLQGKKDIADNLFLVNAIKRIKFETYLVGGSRAKLNADVMMKLPIKVPTLNEQQKIGLFFQQFDSLITLHQRKLDKLKRVKSAYLTELFPAEGEREPKRRFPGFTGAWEQRKLGEVVEMFNGDRGGNYPKNSELVAEGIPFINAGDLQDGQINLENCKRISREKFNQLGGAKIKRGDILYCLRGTIGKNALVDNFDEGTVASSLVDIRPKSIDGMYLFIILNSDIEYRQRVLSDEGAAQPNLSVKNISKFTIPAPETEEQCRIAEFFKSINSLIALHQRKLDKLKKMKAAYLNEMFV